MDTKLKNNHNKKIILTTITVALAAAGIFMVFLSSVGHSVNNLQNENMEQVFMNQLIPFNYVLFSDIARTPKNGIPSYGELYLDVSHELPEAIANPVYYAMTYEFSHAEEAMNFIQDEQAATQNQLRYTADGPFASASLQMDYYAVNNDTKESVSNASGVLDHLDTYLFYVVMDYDKEGRLKIRSVGGDRSGHRLKLLTDFSRTNWLTDRKLILYPGQDGVQSSILIQAGSPENATFAYGITDAQWAALTDLHNPLSYARQFSETSNPSYLFQMNGGPGYFSFTIIIITLLAFVAHKVLRYRLTGWKITKLPLEIGILPVLAVYFENDTLMPMNLQQIAGVIMSSYDVNLTAGQFTFNGTSILSGDPAGLLVYVAAALLFALVFAGWFLWVSGFCALERLPIRDYLMQRSLLWRFPKFLRTTGHKIWNTIFFTDLSKKVSVRLFGATALATGACVLLSTFITYGFFRHFGVFLFGCILLALFFVTEFLLLRRSIEKLREEYLKLLKTTRALSEGDFTATQDSEIFHDVFSSLGKIKTGFSLAVEQEVKSQRMRNELITNVSHDLKTPLTAIITYVDLLKNEELGQAERVKYIETLEKKSGRLKLLIDDLFEVSRASSGDVSLNIVDLDLVRLLKQVSTELSEKIEETDLVFKYSYPDEPLLLPLDSQKTYRIFENLYTNILKYAMGGTRVYISAAKTAGGALVELKNISGAELNINPAELTERFVQGDPSRGTGGQGLGLAIAKSFTELMGGTFVTGIDGDLFKVAVTFQTVP